MTVEVDVTTTVEVRVDDGAVETPLVTVAVVVVVETVVGELTAARVVRVVTVVIPPCATVVVVVVVDVVVTGVASRLHAELKMVAGNRDKSEGVLMAVVVVLAA